MILSLILIPALGAILAFLIRKPFISRSLLLICSALHTSMVVFFMFKHPLPVFGGWLNIDSVGFIFLSIISILFLFSAIYAVGYLQFEQPDNRKDFEGGGIFSNGPESVFTGCLLLFLSSMTMVTISQHLGLLWIGIETTTLATAPLIYFHRHRRSLEAAWKYLLICSVGIGLALIGNVFFALAAKTDAENPGMILGDLISHANDLNPLWLKAGFIFMLVGYGTKMGLVPMHSWLPDAHSESPSLVSALLSGALLNCAFLGILRGFTVVSSAGYREFGGELLVIFGLVSMFVAATFIITQVDYKRLLAYSSIEHMGILALGMGLGGISAYGSLLHALNHSFVKASLFMVAGSLLRIFKTKHMPDVRGIIHSTPLSGVLWITGFLAISGSPPFGLFISEFTILRGAMENGHILISILFLIVLGVVFIAMASSLIPMVQGIAAQDTTNSKDYLIEAIPPLILLAAVFVLGLYIPEFVTKYLKEAAQALGGT